MIAVKFIQNNLPYAAGEVAHFPDDHANRLIRAKMAVAVPEKTPSAPIVAPKPPETITPVSGDKTKLKPAAAPSNA
jgi:hypothetical protein